MEDKKTITRKELIEIIMRDIPSDDTPVLCYKIKIKKPHSTLKIEFGKWR